MKIYQGELYALYFDLAIVFRSPIFHQFNSLVDVQHEGIFMKSITNPTTSIDHLAFECQAQHIWPNTPKCEYMDSFLGDKGCFMLVWLKL
jgi:hypothetical protein